MRNDGGVGLKALSITTILMLLAAACTNLAVPPTASIAPTVGPTGATPTASPSPSPAPTASPTASVAPTVSPSVALTPSTAPSASASPVAPTGEPTPTAISVAPPGSDLERLMSHIPDSFRVECRQVTSFDGGFLVGVQCVPNPGEGYVTYYLFDTVENLNASYQGNLDFFGEEATGTTCQSEAAEGGYTIDGTPAGRLMCAPYEEGLIAFWTHEGLLIESTIVYNEPSYPELYAIWQAAGPNLAEASASPSPVTTWTTNASSLRGRNGEQFNFVCPAGGTAGTVWGTDTYTDDSSVCTAAVHAGLITLANGGTVTFEMRPGQDSYVASTRNGISSNPWGVWSSSFVFMTP